MKKELKIRANEVLELAKGYGVEQNLLFVSTFERYQTQLQILEKLKETIESEGGEPPRARRELKLRKIKSLAARGYSAMRAMFQALKVSSARNEKAACCPSKFSICPKCGK